LRHVADREDAIDVIRGAIALYDRLLGLRNHLGILSEMFDLVLPATAIDARATGAGQFCARYGLRDKPLRIRFRMLDPNLAVLPGGVDQDVTLDQHSFSTLATTVDRVFMTENEINFLSFPSVAGAMVVFGAGYGFDKLGIANWLFGDDRFW